MVLALILMVLGYLLSCGTRAYDRPQNEGGDRTKLAASPVMGVVAIGSRTEGGRWAEPPFVPPPDWRARAWNYWMMSQKGGTASYLIFSAGFSLGLFLLFDSLVKRFGVEVGLFRSLGRNAIVCYALHGFLIDMIGWSVKKNAEPWLVLTSLLALLILVYFVARVLEVKRIFIRL